MRFPLVSLGKFVFKIWIVTPIRSLLVSLFAAHPNRAGWERRLLIVNLEALGDLVVMTGVLKHYKRRFPDTHITLLIKAGTGLEYFLRDSFVHRVLTVRYSRFAGNPFYGLRMVNTLRRIGFARVVNHDFSGAEIMGKMIGLHVGARETVGYEGMRFEYHHPFDLQQKLNLRIVRTKLLPRYTTIIPAISGDPASDRLPHALAHYRAIYERATGYEERDYAPQLAPPKDTPAILERFGLVRGKYAVFNVSASVAYKRWPLGRFIAVARVLVERNIRPVVIGVPADRARGAAFVRECPDAVNLVGKTTFAELVAIIHGSHLVVTNDTSTVHLAVALRKPSLCITGGGQFGMFQDYGYSDINRWAYLKTPCYGDNWRCGRRVPRGSPSPCIDAVTVHMTTAILEALLERLATGTGPRVAFAARFEESHEDRAALPSAPRRPLRILYAGIQAENYNPARKLSFEYNNFYLTLKHMAGVEVQEFPYDPIIEWGRRAFNERLLKTVRAYRPDLFFAFMFTDELDPRTLNLIRREIPTVAWFADDHWRLENYSRFYAPHFTWTATTWSKAPERYAQHGITNVIRSQWACNPLVWKPIAGARDIPVAFVGQYNSARAENVRALRAAGVNVWVRGWRWPEGRLSQEEVVQSFSRSKVNLNFSTPPSRFRPRLLARLFFRRSAGSIIPDVLRVPDNLASWRDMAIPQIKARPFEILGCRTFLISGFADDMDQYYEDGKEIVYYDGTTEDLVRKIQYYLAHDDERERIAEAGYARTMREHTYEQRFKELFRRMGLFYAP